MISLTIHIDTPEKQWKGSFKKMSEKIERAAGAAFVVARRPAAFSSRNFSLNIVLTDDKSIKTLNHDYRGQNKATNVLSFPQFDIRKFDVGSLAYHPSPTPVPLGDVVLAWETVKKECKAQKKDLENHTIHLVVHGTLHLLGYDHMKNKEAKSMESLECDILKSLGYPDPYK
ncbi:MAG: rRNA maturation RNase YbeY [Alphaproteobacteria bacterium]